MGLLWLLRFFSPFMLRTTFGWTNILLKRMKKGFRKNKKAGSNNYLCTFRVGEIYLTAAEAAARLGELSQARTRLLELMRKRYAPEAYEAKSVVVNAMDKEALVQEILDERARELAFEGHRWFDLRRSTRPRLEKCLMVRVMYSKRMMPAIHWPFRKKP